VSSGNGATSKAQLYLVCTSCTGSEAGDYERIDFMSWVDSGGNPNHGPECDFNDAGGADSYTFISGSFAYDSAYLLDVHVDNGGFAHGSAGGLNCNNTYNGIDFLTWPNSPPKNVGNVDYYKSDVPGITGNTTYTWAARVLNGAGTWVSINYGSNWNAINTTDCSSSGNFAKQSSSADVLEYWTQSADTAPHPANC
jgi:hypothetical protein